MICRNYPKSREVIRTDPGNQWAWAFKGDALFGLNKCDEAKEAYKKALGINPNNPVAQQGLQMAEDPAICKPKTGS